MQESRIVPIYFEKEMGSFDWKLNINYMTPLMKPVLIIDGWGVMMKRS